MGMIGVLEITLIVPTLLRGNASQDAPRPLVAVAEFAKIMASHRAIALSFALLQPGYPHDYYSRHLARRP